MKIKMFGEKLLSFIFVAGLLFISTFFFNVSASAQVSSQAGKIVTRTKFFKERIMQ